MEEGRGAYKVLVGQPEGTDPLKDLGIQRKVVLKLIFKKWKGGALTALMWIRIGKSGRLLLTR
jgi:hypothetical protein